MKYNFPDINARLQEQMISVLESIALEDKRDFDFPLEVKSIGPLICIINTMVLSENPVSESMRILRCLLKNLQCCEQVAGRDSGAALTIGFGIQAVANCLPEPLWGFWSAELEAASHEDKALLEAVQSEHDQMMKRVASKSE
jgi:hypothetical protein